MTTPGERLRNGSRNPFEVYLLAWSGFYGVIGSFVREARPGSLQEAVGVAFSQGWSILVALGSIMALLGIVLGDRATGLILEAGGCLIAGGATLFYVAVLLWASGGTSLAAGSVLLGFGSACCARTWQIRRVLHVAADRHRGKWR